MKPMRQMVCALLAVTLLIPAAAASPGSGNPLWDVQGHWAQKEIQEAVAAGWVDGYPDGSFQPEKTITRAEFTKLLLDAIHLTPDSETVAWKMCIRDRTLSSTSSRLFRSGQVNTFSFPGKGCSQ